MNCVGWGIGWWEGDDVEGSKGVWYLSCCERSVILNEWTFDYFNVGVHKLTGVVELSFLSNRIIHLLNDLLHLRFIHIKLYTCSSAIGWECMKKKISVENIIYNVASHCLFLLSTKMALDPHPHPTPPWLFPLFSCSDPPSFISTPFFHWHPPLFPDPWPHTPVTSLTLLLVVFISPLIISDPWVMAKLYDLISWEWHALPVGDYHTCVMTCHLTHLVQRSPIKKHLPVTTVPWGSLFVCLYLGHPMVSASHTWSDRRRKPRNPCCVYIWPGLL